MKTKQTLLIALIFVLGVLNIGKTQCNIQASICESGTMSQSFNFVSTSGSYAGGAFANAGCNTGAAGQHRYGFITLYITQSGYLNLLIDGNSNSGFIDVAIFRVPNGVAPCVAIQSSSNAIGCNYASSAGGCVEFGSNFPCASEVNAPYVNAGDEIMIVAQSYTSGTSTTFQLQLSDAPGTAQTGVPDATIDPSSLGPFCSTGSPIQLTATNMGGTWSGPGISSTGMFNPQAVGPGAHTINYSIGVAPCNSSSSSQVVVGSMNISNMNVGGCAAGTHNITGTVNIVSPPSSGHLMVQNCDGQQVIVASAPFSAGSYPFNLTGLNPNGAPCQIQAYFADNQFSHSLVYCSHALQYTAPTCTSNCSFTSINATPTGCNVGNTYTLNGSISFVNPPTSGQLIVQDCSGNSQTFNAPFSSPINYSINSLTPNGASCNVTASFTANTSCTTSTSYTTPSIPIVTASPDISICPGVTVNLSASGADSYLWDNGGGNSSSATVSPTSTTTYTVTGTTNGCTAAEEVTVTIETNSLTPSISSDTTICEGISTYISSSGGISYSWGVMDPSGPGPIINTGDSIIVTPTETTTYYVFVEDADGCTGGNLVTITVNPSPDVSATDITLCATETEPIIASGADAYSWSPATYLNTTSGSTVTFTPGQSTTYTIVGTGTNGCTDTTTVDATVYPNPIIDAGTDQTICEGGQITLTAQGAGTGTGTSYVWDSPLISNGTPFVPPVGTNVYTVTGTNSDGCTGTDQVTITVNAAFALTMTPTNATICQGTSTTISASGANTYLWSNGETNSSISVSPATTTTYTVTGADAAGCTGAGQVTVTVNTNPVISSNNVEVCVNGTVQIQASGASTYAWSPAIYLNNTTGQTVNFTPGVTTVYTITGTGLNGCTGTTTVTATANPNPIIEAGNDITVCEGNQVTLSAGGLGTSGGTYVWSPGVANNSPFIPPVGTTVYTVTGIDSKGCTGTDFLTVYAEPIQQLAFTAIQNQNCVPVEAVFQSTGASGVSCKWIFDNGQTAQGCNNITQSFPYPGAYGATLTVESANGCIATLYQDSVVIVNPNPIASFTPSPVVFNTTNTLVNFTNNSSGATSYSWNFGDDLGTGSTQFSPSYTYPEEAGGYLVRLISFSDAGCSDTAYYSLRAEEDLIFYIPNSFTPDNDEFNQTFQPVFTSGFDPFDYTLIIFNRWGEKVFESNDATIGWKGNYGVNGSNCQEGTYTWKIEFKTIKNDERKTHTGHVNLMR